MQAVSECFAVWSSATNRLFGTDGVPLLFSTESKAKRFLAKLKSTEWRVVRVEIMMDVPDAVMGRGCFAPGQF